MRRKAKTQDDKRRRVSLKNTPPLIPTNGNSRKKYFKLKYFIEQYMIDLDAYKAYERAGFATRDKERDRKAVVRLMAKPEIQQAVYEKQQEIAERFQVNQERVIKELSLLALSNIKDIASWTANSLTFKSSDNLNRDQTAVVAEIVCNDTPKGGTTLRVRMYDKKSALIDLGKHLGLFWEDSNKLKDPVEEARKIKEALKQMKEMTSPSPEEENVPAD